MQIFYIILYVKDVEDYVQRDILQDEYVWLIDQEHKINVKTVDWIPNPFEGGMIHVFRMSTQPTEKYPWQWGRYKTCSKIGKAEIKIHCRNLLKMKTMMYSCRRR